MKIFNRSMIAFLVAALAIFALFTYQQWQAERTCLQGIASVSVIGYQCQPLKN